MNRATPPRGREPPQESVPAELGKSPTYCTVRLKVVLCWSWFGAVPLVAVTVTVNVPVGVPVTTLKFTGLDAPPPGAVEAGDLRVGETRFPDAR